MHINISHMKDGINEHFLLSSSFLTLLDSCPACARQNQSALISFHPNLFLCLGELTIVCVCACVCFCVCVCVCVSITPSGGLCAGPQNMRLSITSYCLRLEPHRSGLSSDKRPDLEYIHLDRAHTRKHTHTHTQLLFFCCISTTPHSTLSRECTPPHTHIPEIFTDNRSLAQSSPCAVNIEGGMIFPVGGCSFVCSV